MTDRAARPLAHLRRTAAVLLLIALSVLGTAFLGWGLSAPGAPARAALPTAGPSAAAAAPPVLFGTGHAPLFPPLRPTTTSQIGNCTTTPVVPGCGYDTGEPAPMGIADYGVSGYGNPTPYAYGTDAFLGTVSWTDGYIYSSAQKGDFSVQLNVVLNFINGGQNYSFWIQDVPVPVDTTKNDFAMSYADNIWNFSCASSTCNLASGTGTVSGNGTNDGGVYIWPASANSGCAGGKTGTCDTLDGPSWFGVEVRTFLNPSGEPVVRFCYDDAKTALSCYDTVTFGFAKKVTTFRGFFVDGFSMNPTGLFENAELTFGGPGNGASTDNTGPSNINTALDFWNGNNFQAVPAAWNGGDDTAEAISEDQSIFTNDGMGTPLSVQLNGTTRDDTELPTYMFSQVGTLAISAPAVATGTVAVHVRDWNFTNDAATLTLVPGTYPVWVNATGGASTFLGMCTITGGSTLSVSTSSTCPTGGGGGTPSVTAPSAAPASIDVGQTATFSTTASGGTGSYSSYAWTVSPATGLSCPATTTSGSATCTASASNHYTVSVTVTDSGGHTSSPATSPSFTVYPTPTVSVPTASASSITLGQSVTFSTTLGLAGSGGDTYGWATTPASGAGCTASTSTSYTCTPTVVGSYTATATATDSNGGSGSNTSAAVSVVSAAPTVGAPTASPSSVDMGQTVTWSATVSGGTPAYTYAWSSSPASGLGCPASTAPPITCTPTAAGSYTLTLTVTDSKGNSGHGTSASFVVSAAPTVSTPTFSPSSVDTGETLTVSATVTGTGSGGDTLSWSSSPTGLGCPTTGSSPISCSPTTPGTYTVTATVKDSNGGTGSAQSASITVDAPPVVTTPVASPSTPEVGVSFTLSSTLSSPGSGGVSYTWTISPSGLGCATANALSITCTPTTAGSYTVGLSATDTNGGSDAVSTTISATGGGLTVSISVSSNPATAGTAVSFTASVSENAGGAGTYVYSWHFGDGGASASASPSYAYQSSGSYTVTLFVNDTQGHTGHATFSLTVNPASGGGSGFSGLGFLGPYGLWILLLVVVLVVAVIAAVALSRRKKASGPGTQEWMAPDPMGGGYVVGPPMPPGATGGPNIPAEPPPSSDDIA